MTIFIISLAVLIISIIILIVYKIKKLDFFESILGVSAFICICVSIMFGFIVLPLLVEDKIEKQLIEEYEVIKGKNAIILDFSIDNKNLIKEYDSHKAYMEIGDSTRFYFITYKSFYGNNLRHDVIWRNPPYENLNLE